MSTPTMTTAQISNGRLNTKLNLLRFIYRTLVTTQVHLRLEHFKLKYLLRSYFAHTKTSTLGTYCISSYSYGNRYLWSRVTTFRNCYGRGRVRLRRCGESQYDILVVARGLELLVVNKQT